MAARHEQCKGCGQELLVQLVGRAAALNVRADPHPLPHPQAIAMREPNRLAWHAHQLHNGDIELRWINPSTHPRDCRTDVIQHACAAAPLPPQPPPPTRRRRAPTPGQEGLFDD